MRLFAARVVLCTVFMLSFATLPKLSANDGKHRYEIPAGEAVFTLKEVAQKAGIEIIYSADVVKGVQTQAVSGWYTPMELFEVMLADTPLTVSRHKESGVIAIRRKSVSLENPKTTEETDMKLKPKKGFLKFLLAMLPVATPVALPAQEEADQDIYELSPFIVDTTDDIGYLANNTLAGSRLNAKLTDIANAVEVFTPELIGDLAAFTEEDLMVYSSTAVFDLSEQSAQVQGINIVDAGFAFRLRGMAGSRTRNFFDTFIAPDTYNTGRFDQSRGPNSILFGLGGAGGILNASTKRAMNTGNFGSLNLATDVGDHDRIRVHLDYNLTLNDKFAVRFNGLIEDGNGWRPHEFKDNQRIHLTSTYHALENLTIRAEYEKGDMESSHQRNNVPIDSISRWVDNGRPTATSFNSANTGVGIGRRNNNQRVTFIDNDGSFRNFQQSVYSIAGTSNEPGSPHRMVLTDTSLVPFDGYWGGPGNYSDVDFEIFTLTAETELIENLFVELAYNYQSEDQLGYDANWHSAYITGEPSPTFRDGDANPYTGQLYYDTTWVTRAFYQEQNDYRLTASYTVDTGNRWLGRHNVAGLWSRYELDRYRPRHNMVLSGAPFNVRAEHNRNKLYVRHYVDPTAGAADFRIPDWRDIPNEVSVKLNNGSDPVTYQRAWVPWAIEDDSRENTSYQISTQSFFLDDRLVATVGFRHDKVTNSARSLSSANEDRDENGVKGWADPVTRELSADNLSYGLVYKVTDWMSLIYNDSENFTIPGASALLMPDNALQPIKKGQSNDYGAIFNFLDNRFYVRVAYFENSSVDENNAVGAGSNVATRNDRILDALVDQGIMTDSEADSRRVFGSGHDLRDRTSKGWELNMTANPLDNLRITMNFTSMETVESDNLKVTKQVIEDLRPEWESYDSTIETDGEFNGAPRTIAGEIAQYDEWFAEQTALLNKKSIGDRDLQLRLFTRYDFKDGLLKGAFLGGGVRYSGAPVIGADVNGNLYRGEITRELDLLMGYKTKVDWFGDKKQNLSLQLNIRDMLQQNEYLSVKREIDGNLWRARVVAPTRTTLSVRLNF
ncbi:MAG: hypothetical protein MI748_12455 [Opitutales bacterium]|nr:hypothetical protein [Opitutales bacterium]